MNPDQKIIDTIADALRSCGVDDSEKVEVPTILKALRDTGFAVVQLPEFGSRPVINRLAELEELPDRSIIYEPRRDIAWMKDDRSRFPWFCTGSGDGAPSSSIILPVVVLTAAGKAGL